VSPAAGLSPGSTRSIRWRLVAAFVGVSLFTLLVVGAVFYAFLGGYVVEKQKDLLLEQVIEVAEQVEGVGQTLSTGVVGGRVINALLRADSAVTPDAMRRFQTDPGSPRADMFVPLILESVAGSADDTVRRAATLLGEWSRTYTTGDQRAILFEYIMDEMSRLAWDELAGEAGDWRRALVPNDMALLAILRDSASAWWDQRETPAVERRAAIVAASLTSALTRTLDEHGDPDAGGWTWSRVRGANIRHPLGIRAWSALAVPVQGGTSTLSPLSGSGAFGPSWRMVVELGPEVRAWGTYPGGQSGHPASSAARSDWVFPSRTAFALMANSRQAAARSRVMASR